MEGAIPSLALDSQVLKMVLLTRTKNTMNYYFNDRDNYATKTTEYLE
jgi:hypothetical protein